MINFTKFILTEILIKIFKLNKNINKISMKFWNFYEAKRNASDD